MEVFKKLPRKIIHHRYMIRVMAIREIKSRYVGSIIGLFWSVIHPIMMVFIYWFVFSLGFKVQPNENIPFVLWFFCAFVPWSTFSEMLGATTNSVVIHGTLIKRTLFPSEILPFIYLVSSGISHLIMLAILLVMLMFNGIPFSWHNLQFLYYWFALTVLMLGLGWLFSGINVFLRDTHQLVGVLLQMWFWGTPIFWTLEMLPRKLHLILKLNPMFYIVQGYRDSFLYQRPIWDNPKMGLYFWGLCLPLLLIGGLVFRKLKPDFADVL
ncbi:MAG: ABC transporter permease [SAR324 cluster bacterium]|nr:ABC transporter permease [SAR324 cluster bacterium]